ncbi:MAG TPA: DUF4142 domain-containing protein [Lacunisphaera sp.]|nr:DUF4142 domain-containing protein [Lacunisphaera sp.]
MKTSKSILSVALAATLACLVQASPELSRSDRQFFEKAAKSGMKEVAVSEAVMSNLTSPGIREFARTMSQDHAKANEELKALAMKKGVTLPAPDPKPMNKWSKNTKDTDDEYIAEMVDDHKDAVDLFEKAAKSDDPDIAAFAQKTLPTLRHHLEMAKMQKKAN